MRLTYIILIHELEFYQIETYLKSYTEQVGPIVNFYN